MKLKTGARGLRTIMEDKMLELMYDVPSEHDIEKIVIDENVINNNQKPIKTQTLF